MRERERVEQIYPLYSVYSLAWKFPFNFWNWILEIAKKIKNRKTTETDTRHETWTHDYSSSRNTDRINMKVLAKRSDATKIDSKHQTVWNCMHSGISLDFKISRLEFVLWLYFWKPKIMRICFVYFILFTVT